MNMDESKPPGDLGSNAGLGPLPERLEIALAAVLEQQFKLGALSVRCPRPNKAQCRPATDAIQAAADAIKAALRDERAKPVPDEWLVKVRRLVEGFEHVSGIARLWEPDYSSGSERALWARATDACADVAKLLAEMKKA